MTPRAEGLPFREDELPLETDLPIEQLADGPHQPRLGSGTESVGLDELGESLALYGQQDPVIGYPDPVQPGLVRIISGHRRVAAGRKKKLKTMRVRIIPRPTEADSIALSILTNTTHVQMNDAELARAAEAKRQAAPGMTETELGKRIAVGKTKLCHLNAYFKLHQSLRQLADEGKLSAVVMYYLKDFPHEVQIELARGFLSKTMTVDQLRNKKYEVIGKQERKPRQPKATIKLAPGVTLTADDIEKLKAAIDAFLPLIRRAKSLEDLQKPEGPTKPDDQSPGSPPPQAPPPPPPAA